MNSTLSYSFFDPKILPNHRVWDSHKSNPVRYYFNVPAVILTNHILFPDHKIEIYTTKNTAESTHGFFDIFEILSEFVDIEVVDFDYNLTEPSILRMKPLWKDLDCLHPKDIDSIITELEYKYISLFEQSEYTIGTLRTHQNHWGYGCCMLAGMSSFKPNQIPESVKGFSYNEYYTNNHLGYGCDQDLMIQTFTKNKEYCKKYFYDCYQKTQTHQQDFKCHVCSDEDLSSVDTSKHDHIFNMQKKLGFDEWCGLPVDCRGEYTKYILELFPDVMKKIYNSKLLSEVYL
jgi:hypothetical protein